MCYHASATCLLLWLCVDVKQWPGHDFTTIIVTSGVCTDKRLFQHQFYLEYLFIL
jgi:hypothetical protein